MLSRYAHLLFVLVLLVLIFFATSAHSAEVVSGFAIPAEVILSEALTSSVLSYYKEDPFETFSYAAFQSAFEATPSRDFGLNSLYMGMIAESTYLFGSLLGHKGSLGVALAGAYLPPIAFYIVADMVTLSHSKAASAAQFGVAFAPISSALAYHWSKSLEGFRENRENADFVTAQIAGSYYGMAIANIGLKQFSLGLGSDRRFLSATSFGVIGGLSAYGIGELRGSGDGSLGGTLLSGFAPAAVAATAGALIGGSYWLDGYYWGTITSCDTAAPIGYGLFQSEGENSKLAQVIGGYYGSAIVGSSMELLSRWRFISDKRFAVIRATVMSLSSGLAAYGVGEYREENDDDRLGQTIAGSIAAPFTGLLLTSFVGVPEGYDEMYRVGSFFSPLTAVFGYQFPTDDFHSSEDNSSVFAAEVYGGYVGTGVVALGLNHVGCDIEGAWSDWKRAVIRSTVLPLASACIVYALGEKYGSGNGTFLDSLKGSFIAPVGLAVLPVAIGVLEYGGYGGDTDRFWRLARNWDEGSLIGTFLSPVLAAVFYSNGADNGKVSKEVTSGSLKAAPRRWEVRFPMLMKRL